MTTSCQETYVCEAHAGFIIRVGKTRLIFEKHQLILTDELLVKKLDKCIKKYPHIRSKIKKVDIGVANALVAQHKASHGGAHAGPFSSSVMSQAETAKVAMRDEQFSLIAEKDKTTITDAIVKDSALVLSEKLEIPAVKPPVSTLKETIKEVKKTTISSSK